MTETPRAPFHPQLGRLAPRARSSRLNSLEALERGFALFRSTFGREAWRYYAGAAPFLFAFIPLWVANGQVRFSNGTLLLEAALLAGAYLFRAWMISSYVQRVRERAFGTPASKPAGVIGRAADLARLLAWKVALSVGALAAAPTVVGLSWLYAAGQFASIEAREDGSETHTLGGCLGLASRWFSGSLLLLVMLFPLWIAAWLNGLIVALVVPQLLHSILGLNTLLSTAMGIFALIRSSAFWLALFAGAWLAFDPIIKCSFVVVHQHLRSLREGDDLRGLLASLPREQKKREQMIGSFTGGGKAALRALVLLAAVLTSASLPSAAFAAQTQVPQNSLAVAPNPQRQAEVQKLRQALEKESQRAIYRWHDAEHPSPPTWLDRQLEKLGKALSRAWNAIGRLLGKLWPRGFNLPSGSQDHSAWQLKDLRFWLILLGTATLAVGTVLFWLRSRRKNEPLSVPARVAPLPDLSEAILATARSEDEWFALANQLQQEGELRLAVRAAYLGLLAGLGQRQWLSIRRDRTNREYLEEFKRRWRRRPQAAVDAQAEVAERLRSSLRQFDVVWYGSREVTPEGAARYQREQMELLSHV